MVAGASMPWEESIERLIAEGNLRVIPATATIRQPRVCVTIDGIYPLSPLRMHYVGDEAKLAQSWALGRHRMLVHMPDLLQVVGGEARLAALLATAPVVQMTSEGERRAAMEASRATAKVQR